ncbi:diablo IAP-binding mitochondrial protein-like isoform X2 [Dunckerocampus dactyliophorus]|uniref:diablo IAP-binding mitochondrial protein-like isoform X2 n=1 Tax=Dunckerocampus dactyliophorus TaxID=161453 RepID=UPI0024072E15|nr:diablo IAP-binding mitochondrial protein-like isoform X2 [Dunckerocampus dactyliophorus]
MQTVRQCSACASRAAGGLLRSQADVLVLQSDKSIPRRGASCSRFLGFFISSRKAANRNTMQWKDAAHTSTASLSLSPSMQRAEHLTYCSLIRRAASLVTDSTSTLLSQSTMALIDASASYTKAVHTRIALQRRYLVSLGKLSPAEEDSLQQAIFRQKAEVSEQLSECKRSETTWIKAVNLCKMAAEAAYASGAEQASITLRANIQLAQSHVDEARKLSAEADKKLAETKVEEIQRMAEYASSLEDCGEHQIHEAYLRED